MGWLNELFNGTTPAYISFSGQRFSPEQFSFAAVSWSLDESQRVVTSLIELGKDRDDDNIFARMQANELVTQLQVLPLVLATYAASLIQVPKAKESVFLAFHSGIEKALRSGSLDQANSEMVGTAYVLHGRCLVVELAADEEPSALNPSKAASMTCDLICKSLIELSTYRDKPKLEVNAIEQFGITSILNATIYVSLATTAKMDLRVGP